MTQNASTSFQADRCAGTMLGMACGDALGAPHEFGQPLSSSLPLEMSGGGPFGFEPGEYTDDTAMAVPIARAVAEGKDLRDENVIAAILAEWLEWLAVTKDVGIQTRIILSDLRASGDISEQSARTFSREMHDQRGRSAGNGALMRTAPVALRYLDDPIGLTEAARRIAQLTHWDDDAGDACVLWCHAIALAVTTGELDIRPGLDFLPAERQLRWVTLIDEAENCSPEHFHHENGWVVAALQGAWSAIVMGMRAGERSVGMIERAVRGGGDTDTVAAITGSLAGAAFGASSLPAKWRRTLHGWGGPDGTALTARDLSNFGVMAQRRGKLTERSGWPLAERFEPDHNLGTLVAHPHDDGVLLASIDVLDDLPEHVDAIVSMCRVGTRQIPADDAKPRELIEFWLIDRAGYNLDADFVLRDAADTIAELRAEGKVVLLHCWAAHSRTPSVAIAYSVRHLGIDIHQAFDDVVDALPDAHPNAEFRAALASLGD